MFRCMSNGVSENTPAETFDFMIKVLAKNTYTKRVVEVHTEGDVDWEDSRDEFVFVVKNTLNGKCKIFTTLWDALDYKDRLWNKFNIKVNN